MFRQFNLFLPSSLFSMTKKMGRKKKFCQKPVPFQGNDVFFCCNEKKGGGSEFNPKVVDFFSLLTFRVRKYKRDISVFFLSSNIFFCCSVECWCCREEKWAGISTPNEEGSKEKDGQKKSNILGLFLRERYFLQRLAYLRRVKMLTSSASGLI